MVKFQERMGPSLKLSTFSIPENSDYNTICQLKNNSVLKEEDIIRKRDIPI